MSAGTTPYSPTGASFTPIPDLVLTARTGSSYAITAGTVAAVGAHLARQGWHREPGRSEHEVARLRLGRGLIVLYAASVLVQGDQCVGHPALALLVEEPRR